MTTKIEMRKSKSGDYYIVWIYDHGILIGFNKFYTLAAARQFARDIEESRFFR